MTTHDDTTQAAATAIPLPPRGLITAVIHASATSLPAVELDYGIWVLLPGTIQPGVAAMAGLIGLEATLAYRDRRRQRGAFIIRVKTALGLKIVKTLFVSGCTPTLDWGDDIFQGKSPLRTNEPC